MMITQQFIEECLKRQVIDYSYDMSNPDQLNIKVDQTKFKDIDGKVLAPYIDYIVEQRNIKFDVIVSETLVNVIYTLNNNNLFVDREKDNCFRNNVLIVEDSLTVVERSYQAAKSVGMVPIAAIIPFDKKDKVNPKRPEYDVTELQFMQGSLGMPIFCIANEDDLSKYLKLDKLTSLKTVVPLTDDFIIPPINRVDGYTEDTVLYKFGEIMSFIEIAKMEERIHNEERRLRRVLGEFRNILPKVSPQEVRLEELQNITATKPDTIVVEENGVTQMMSKQEANNIIKRFLGDRCIDIENNLRTLSRAPSMLVFNRILFDVFTDIVVNNNTLKTQADLQMPFDIDINHYIKYNDKTPSIRKVVTESLKEKGIDHPTVINFILQLYAEDVENYLKFLLVSSIGLIDEIIMKLEGKAGKLFSKKKSNKANRVFFNIDLLKTLKVFLTNGKNSKTYQEQIETIIRQGTPGYFTLTYVTELSIIDQYLDKLIIKRSNKIDLSDDEDSDTNIKLNAEINLLFIIQSLINIEIYSQVKE